MSGRFSSLRDTPAGTLEHSGNHTSTYGGLSLPQLTFHPFQLLIGQNSCPSPTKGANRVMVCGPCVAARADGYVSKFPDCAQTRRAHT